MKKLFYIVLLLVSTIGFAQNKGITYQAVIYAPGGQNIPGVNVSNIPLTNRSICLKFSFLDAATAVEYEEVVKTTTDEFGMVNITIGSSNQTGGYASSYAAIAWSAAADKSLKVSLDATGLCSQFDELSTEELASVPFANAALTAENVSGIVPLIHGGTGAATAVAARTNLGLGNVDNTSDMNKPMSTATKIYVDSQLVSSSIPDATTTSKGKLQLAGDLSGTAEAPTVPGLVLKENTANKSTVVTLGTSNVLFPTQNAVKTYVDTAIAGATIVDADATTKGKLQLAGDLSGSANAPTIASNAITTAKVADNAITDAKIATVSGVKIAGNIPGNATNVTGVVDVTNGGTGATTVSAARTNLGLGSAALNNTSDFETPLSFSSPLVRTVNSITLPPAEATVNGYLKATDFNIFSNKINSTEKAANNGVATLGNDGKIPSSQIPAISFQSVNVVNSQAAMIANSAAQVGSITIRTDINRNFVLSNLPASTLSNWIELSTPTSVTSVNGYAGPNVSLTKADIVLGNVDNTSDNNKPISIDTRAALDLKANLASPTFTGTVSGITKTMVGLSNVDNTTDAGKPISTATQTALDLKANVTDVTTSLALKANVTDVTTSLALKANVTDVTTSLALKEDTANKTISVTTDGASDVKFPSAKAVKTYADGKVVDGITDAVTTISPSQNAVYDALQLKENSANKSTATDLGSTNPSDVLFPSQKAVKTYVDLQSANAGVADGSITSAKILDGTLVTADYADGSVTPAKFSGVLPINKGGTNATTVTAAKTNFGLENVDNTTDANKPVSTAQQTALDLKANLASPTFTGTVSGITKSMVGLGNVDNTTDANKPVSTATQTALDLKENLANKSTDIVADATSTTKYPSVKLIKDYVDALNAAAGVADGSITYAKIQNVATGKVLGRVSANAGVVEEIATTGTGDVVRATSPTLVTPTLGAAIATSVGFSGSTSGTATLAAPAVAGTTTITLPSATGTLATLAGTEILTNKTLTSPTLTTPALGVATATTVNKVTITAPTTSATLTIADGKTLTANNSIVLAGTDGKTMTFPATDATIARTDAAQTFTGTQTFSATIAGSITGNAATVTTNANLTGDVTSTGNATTIGASKVVTGMIADSNVTNTKLATGIDATKLADGSVTNTELQYIGTLTSDVQAQIDALSTSDSSSTIAINGINTLANGKIYLGNASNEATEVTPTGDITITNAGVTAIGTGKVVTTMLATDAVTTAKITNANVTTSKLADDAVETVKIKNTAVTTDKIADANVTEAKLASNAVTSAKIKDGEIATLDIANAAITYAKIQNVASGKVLGNFTGSIGVVEEIATTGSGNVVRATSPTLVTPTLGVATATSINGLTPTSQTTGFTIAGGTTSKTLTVSGDATVSGTNTGDQTTITGNAGTATKLATARKINTVDFDGSADITVTADATTLTGTSLKSTIVGSSLTSVGTLTNLTVTNAIAGSITGNAATVTTNANLTGPITSVGNATSVASQTGTGTKFVMDTSPTLVTPTLGVATATSINGLIPTAQTTGFTIAGGTTSKTLTVSGDATVSGTNTGDQTITLTGDVTGTGTGSFATTIGAGKVTNTMLAGSIDLTAKVTGILPVNNGGTGSATQNFVDLTTAQTVAGDKTFSGNTAVSGTSTLTVGTGATALGGTLAVTGATTLNGNTSVSGTNTLTVGTGATALGGTLAVTGATTLNGNTSVSGSKTLTVGTGATTLGGTLGVTGATTLSSTLGITGDVTVNTDKFKITASSGNTEIAGTLKVAGGSPGAGKVLTSDANGLASWNSNPNTALTTVTAATYSVVAADKYVIYSNAAAGTITLPDATSSGVGKGKEFIIKNISAFGVTVNTTTSQKIVVDNVNNAATTATLGVEASNNWIRVISDGAQWIAFRALF